MYFYRSRIEAVVSCLELPGIGLLVWLAFPMCTGDLHYLIPILPVFAERHFFHARESNLYFQSWTETFSRWGGRGRERVSPRQRADCIDRGRSLGLPHGKSRLRMMSRCNLFFCQSCFTLQPSIGCCWTDDDWMVGLLRTPRPLVIYIVNSKRKENHFAVDFINTAETPLQCDIWAQWLLFCDDVHFNYSPTEHWRIWNWFSCLRPKVGWCALCMTNDWPSAKMHWSIIFSSVLTNA